MIVLKVLEIYIKLLRNHINWQGQDVVSVGFTNGLLLFLFNTSLTEFSNTSFNPNLVRALH